jgi:hypothetical protein
MAPAVVRSYLRASGGFDPGPQGLVALTGDALPAVGAPAVSDLSTQEPHPLRQNEGGRNERSGC